MAAYFSYLPNIYVGTATTTNTKQEYTVVKNIFRRVKAREDLSKYTEFFEQVSIEDGQMPFQIAEAYYGDPELDWVVLLSNNIMNVQTEWPMTQMAFNDFLIKKYGDIEKSNNIHHYETRELKNDAGEIVVPKGLKVQKNFKIEYFDEKRDAYVIRVNEVDAVTNYTYEVRKEELKRNIYLIKPEYLELIIEDINRIMPYKKGSTQYVSRTLKRGEDIKLFD